MQVEVIPCLYDNYSYLLIDGTTAAVVDPSEAWPVMKQLEERNLTLAAVLCTHHHQDHIGGLEDLLDEYPDLEIYGFQQDRPRIPLITHPLADGDRFQVGGMAIDVIHTPGHTSGHIVYRVEDNLFVGDTMFGAGCGRLFEGTAEQMVQSLDRILNCGRGCKVFFGHEYTELNLRFAASVDPANRAIGERAVGVRRLRSQDLPSSPSSLEEELATNPFLRAEDSSIIERLRSEHGLIETNRVSVFAALRELRNHFS